MQEKIELTKARGFGELIEDSIQFYKQNWRQLLRAYFSICGFFWVASLATALFNKVVTDQRATMGESKFGYTYFLALGFNLVSYVVITLTVTCFIVIYKEKGNEPPAVDEVWSYVKYYFFRVAGSYFALALLLFVSVFFLIAPAVYFFVVFSITIPIMVVENSTLSYAFNRSFELMKTRWWDTLGIIIVSELIIMAALVSIGMPVMLIVWGTSFLTNVNDSQVYLYATIVITHLLQFLYILPLIVVTLTYFSYTEQTDQGALFERIKMIGKSNAETTTEQITEEY